MPRPATRPVDRTPSALQLEVLRALERQGARLRWHSYITAAAGVRGRGSLEGTKVMADRLLPSYTVRALVQQGLIEPIDAANRAPFARGATPYRDYHLSPRGRAALVHYQAPA